jgi:peptide/nickel transport system permease protein
MRFITPIFSLIAVLLAISVITFVIASALPGDEAQIRVGKRDDLTTAERNHLVAVTRKELGLDKPYPVQWAIWLEKVVQGDFGSQEGGGSVGKAVLQRIIPSLELTLIVLLVSLPTAALLAVSAVRHGKRVVAKGFGQLLTVGFLFPQFWLAIVLVIIFAVELHWLPASGYTSFSQDPGQHIEHLILPVLALSIPTTALYYRYLRQSLQDVLQTQYIRTARAKGVSESTVLYRHALPNALIPSLSVLGIQFGQLLGGVVVIELILNWPGVGGLLMYAVNQQDNSTLIAVVMAIAVAYVVVSTIIEVLYRIIDPRIRRA